MSRPRPVTAGQPRPLNTVVLLREAYLVLNDLVIARLAERGHRVVRPAHGAVFQYLDDTGTTVSTLAARAQITKQAMAELVQHLERHGYVVRAPDPADRRAKLVLPTAKGRQVVAIAQELVPEVERHIDGVLGVNRAHALRRDLQLLHDVTAPAPVN
jgi:DNA-binding MarR family transcriptional regulator